MTYNRGDVVLVLFPNSDLRTAKRRPGLIVQADSLGTGLGQTIVAMITSNLERAGHPSRVLVSLATPEGQQTGLLSDSVIMTDNLVTLLGAEIDRKIGVLPEMETVDAALKHTLGLKHHR
ncbi:MAG TPA: type II toxin-antitoxin system PemK/MazF family toxin [Oscillatoriaceae cyanobacterium M33_DOE_052]|uniref:Type II toxin-antitoxin system PemK/MazF family toxin n=1 Tax=Planktothricoides sp. SpSt-374 TaxID=2282167 RepID=A0A7C3VTT0_9CYAN|nr:type II toxin-antitoxin system PemK/MazF family toxin [Oscillatoriaceae cyanobacterium M33_DOE_052]